MTEKLLSGGIFSPSKVSFISEGLHTRRIVRITPSEDPIEVVAPASVANFGPGFDVFGLCLSRPFDRIEAEISDEPKVEVEGHDVPSDPKRNVAFASAEALFKTVGFKKSIKMKIIKGIRPKGGMGSSGASALGGALAAAHLLGVRDRGLIVAAALEGERLASGSPHGDNVIPCLLGGFTVVRSTDPLEVVRLDVSFELVVITPEVEVSTEEARGILPKEVPMRSAVKNMALASSLVLALVKGDLRMVGRLLDDNLVIPYRKKLMPWFDEVKEAALESGAYGLSISGSGPTVFAIGDDLDGIGKAVVESFERMDIKARHLVTKVGRGARCLGA